MEFSRTEYWSGFTSPGDLPNPGIEPRSPTLQADSFPAELQRKLLYGIPLCERITIYSWFLSRSSLQLIWIFCVFFSESVNTLLFGIYLEIEWLLHGEHILQPNGVTSCLPKWFYQFVPHQQCMRLPNSLYAHWHLGFLVFLIFSHSSGFVAVLISFFFFYLKTTTLLEVSQTKPNITNIIYMWILWKMIQINLFIKQTQ